MGKCGSVQCGCFHFFPRVYSGKKKVFFGDFRCTERRCNRWSAFINLNDTSHEVVGISQ